MAGGGFVVGDGQKTYPGKLTPFVLFTCVVAAMGGLIFGYDIGISGNFSHCFSAFTFPHHVSMFLFIHLTHT